jgi:hypothetical protein
MMSLIYASDISRNPATPDATERFGGLRQLRVQNAALGHDASRSQY